MHYGLHACAQNSRHTYSDRFVALYFDFVTRRQESIEADNKFWMAPKKL
jgi:hypothetical protein